VLVIGIANKHSIAYGCAKAFREVGAELAVTFLNNKAKPYVEPLANELGATMFLPMYVSKAGELEAVFDRIGREGAPKYLGAVHCIRTQRGPAGRAAELLFQRFFCSHKQLLPLLYPHGAPGGAADEGRRDPVCHELPRGAKGGPQLQLKQKHPMGNVSAPLDFGGRNHG
jgi:hypothetical protein